VRVLLGSPDKLSAHPSVLLLSAALARSLLTPGLDLPSAAHEEGAARILVRGLKAAAAREGALVQKASGALMPHGSDRGELPGRGYTPGRRQAFVTVITVRTGQRFHTVHSMEGRWSGEVEGPGWSRAVSSELSWDDVAGAWHERSRVVGPGTGLTHDSELLLTPVGDGVCALSILKGRDEGGEPWRSGGLAGALPSGDLTVRLTEVVQGEDGADSVLSLTAVNRTTGAVALVETIVLPAGGRRRMRAVQRFAPDGTLAALYTIRESRVLDSVTGALDTPARAGTTARGGRGEEGLAAQLERAARVDPRLAALLAAHKAARAEQAALGAEVA
jgi:hypothetical protein